MSQCLPQLRYVLRAFVYPGLIKGLDFGVVEFFHKEEAIPGGDGKGGGHAFGVGDHYHFHEAIFLLGQLLEEVA